MADTSAGESTEVQLRSGLAECMECGAVVKDYDKHAKWHTDLLNKLFSPPVTPQPYPMTQECVTCHAQVLTNQVWAHQQWHHIKPHM